MSVQDFINKHMLRVTRYFQPKPDWDDPLPLLQKKWGTVPTSESGRIDTKDLVNAWSDTELAALWEISFEDRIPDRGWYHTLYTDFLKDKRVLDVGSGFALDTLMFARNGARVTFMDINADNIKVLIRLCAYYKVRADFVILEDIGDIITIPKDFDVIMALGSLHHAPRSVIEPEIRLLLSHLKPHGRWIQLAYPYSRWRRDGRLPFHVWGQITDGPGTPWAEWYDMPKLVEMFNRPVKPVLEKVFRNGEFIWFDLEVV